MVNGNLKVSVLISLILISFYSCKKENNSVQLTGIFDWEETNYYGKLIGNFSVKNNKVDIDFLYLPNGVYILLITNETNETLTTKIVW